MSSLGFWGYRRVEVDQGAIRALAQTYANGGVLMELRTIVMRLARNPGFAEGDRDRGYTLIAPLTSDGLIDEAAWRDSKAECTVRAFAPGELAREGRLGRRGHNWFFDYERGETEDDEPVFKLEQHKFIVGEYVTIRDEGDTPLVYRVDSVEARR